jgi:ABC-type glycerol-3-phosphate transport system substrate-binding protein
MIHIRKTKAVLASGTAIVTLALTGLTAAPAAAQDGDTVVRFLVPQWASSEDRRIERQIAFQAVIDAFNDADNGMRVEEIAGTVD